MLPQTMLPCKQILCEKSASVSGPQDTAREADGGGRPPLLENARTWGATTPQVLLC